ncbi:hypothetical protein SPHINGOAX6_70873 [Sphingomonas sp. AX6]|nr:hypothetical protein SPHINGOAX6_70873 [Sphingomonas sp. AX6]
MRWPGDGRMFVLSERFNKLALMCNDLQGWTKLEPKQLKLPEDRFERACIVAGATWRSCSRCSRASRHTHLYSPVSGRCKVCPNNSISVGN